MGNAKNRPAKGEAAAAQDAKPRKLVSETGCEKDYEEFGSNAELQMPCIQVQDHAPGPSALRDEKKHKRADKHKKHKENKDDRHAAEEVGEKITITFQPGKIGLKADWNTG